MAASACEVRAQRGSSFILSIGKAYLKSPCLGLVTFFGVCKKHLQGFRNFAKHTLVIRRTTCSATETTHFSCRICSFLVTIKVKSHYFRIWINQLFLVLETDSVHYEVQTEILNIILHRQSMCVYW